MADVNTILPSPSIRRRASYRALSTSASPRTLPAATATFFRVPALEDQPRHFLDACTLCRAPLRPSRDVYMYRGDTPFCSEECRQEQIAIDEVREREASARRRLWHPHGTPSAVKQGATPVVGQNIFAPGADAVIAR